VQWPIAVSAQRDPKGFRKGLSMRQAAGDLFEALDEAEVDWESC
jgi:hypothetical protein